MTSKLTELAQQKSAAELETLSRQSIAWLNRNMRALRNPSNIRRDIAREKIRHRSKTASLGTNTKFLLGGLYFFYYNPKTKLEMPYYDMFPFLNACTGNMAAISHSSGITASMLDLICEVK